MLTRLNIYTYVQHELYNKDYEGDEKQLNFCVIT